jgi:hypothetical protein
MDLKSITLQGYHMDNISISGFMLREGIYTRENKKEMKRATNE